MSAVISKQPSPTPTEAAANAETTIKPGRCPGLPVAELLTIRLDLLRLGNERERERLFAACKNDGIFYLDLQIDGSHFSRIVESMHRLNADLFLHLSDDDKRSYDSDALSSLGRNGYKPVGRNFGGLDGKKDGFETYTIPKNGVMDLEKDASPFVRPPIVDQHIGLLRAFTSEMNGATLTVLSNLSRSLGLSEDETLEAYHRPDRPSPDIIRLLKYHAQPMHERGAPHTPHTDLGTLTFLFTRLPGLQLLPRNAEQWLDVQPRAGCAIVNLGDGMSLLTNHLFHSCLHRVGPLTNLPMDTRHSFAYLVRAEDSTPMTGLKSKSTVAAQPGVKVFTSADWLQRKFEILRLRTHNEKDDWVLTGQKSSLPRWQDP